MSSRVLVTTSGLGNASEECYLAALRQAGLEPRTLTADASDADIHEAISSAGGLVLTGGPDVHPSRYGQPLAGAEVTEASTRRDAVEFAALAAADSGRVPVFAICRGMQVMNVHRGGALVQHIDDHRDGRAQADKWMSWHGIDVLDGSLLARMFPDDLVLANSRHHQAVDAERVGRGLEVVGWAAWDDTVEALQGDNEQFVLGVQWHPENMALAPSDTPERRQARAIFEAFAAAVREFATSAVR